MKGFGGRKLVGAVMWVVVLGTVVGAFAELADVYLKNGTKLRGDVTTTDGEVLIRNAAGELRMPRAEVARIVPVTTPESAPSTSPTTVPATEAGEEPSGAHGAGVPAGPELPPAPPVSDEDIQRLKLGELRLDGPAEQVRVRFLRKGKQRELASEVLEELKRRPDYRADQGWEDVLTRGQPYEKLRLIVRLTELEHADRIVVETDPGVFANFRRRVLPLINRGCARSGCHAGKASHVFRFPLGTPTSDVYAYTNFVLLDGMETRHGPMLDRANPEDSELLYYLMRPEALDRGHPAVKRGPGFKPVIRDREDPQYTAVLDWINSLRVPQPDYGLKYKNPYAGRLAAPPAEGETPPGEGQEMPPPASQPAAE